jgi:hypothetical protein
MDTYRGIAGFTDEEVCKAIAAETRRIMDFWKNHSVGWAPAEVSEILTRSMLDWQSSLAESLETWLGREPDGALILAWVNLGSLVEGLLKLFLCVYYLPAQRQKGMAFSRDYGLMKSPQTHSVLMLVTPIGLAGGVILQAPHLFSVKLLLPAEEPTIEDAIAELLG